MSHFSRMLRRTDKHHIHETRRSIIRCFSYAYTLHLCALCLCIFSICVLSGCQKNTVPEKKNDLDFTVVAGTDIPAELQTLIDDRLKDSFELTYTDGSCLYIVRGYGSQNTDGYSITVNDFYQSDDCLVLDTTLVGPKKGEETQAQESFPYIVIKAEYREESVVFL